MSFLPVDMHVHMVGNGLSGSGCWLKPGRLHGLLANFMLREIGLETSWKSPRFDDAYISSLLRWVEESALTHIVLLAQDEVYDESGKRLDFGSFFVPNDHVLKLAREHSCVLPAVSIHPARRDAIAELERCAAAGAAMVKLLPNCHNVQCSLEQYRPFWEKMHQLGLPFLAHTGGEHTVPQYNTAYADPRVLRLPLECGVTVIAAHAATRSGFRDPDYFPVLLKMMDEYPRLFADLSALNLPLRSAALPILRQPRWQSRVVHGSDFPVPVQPAWARLRGLIPPAEAKRQAMNRNLIDRDFRLKVAMGFEENVFTRVWDFMPVEPNAGA